MRVNYASEDYSLITETEACNNKEKDRSMSGVRAETGKWGRRISLFVLGGVVAWGLVMGLRWWMEVKGDWSETMAEVDLWQLSGKDLSFHRWMWNWVNKPGFGWILSMVGGIVIVLVGELTSKKVVIRVIKPETKLNTTEWVLEGKGDSSLKDFLGLVID